MIAAVPLPKAASVAASNVEGYPPIIDGIVGVDEWEGASVTGDFVQYEPRRGDPATRATEVPVLNAACHTPSQSGSAVV